MKAIISILVAAGILYVFDIEYNDGRYIAVVKEAVGSLARR